MIEFRCYHCGTKFDQSGELVMELACPACKLEGHSGWSASCEICHPKGTGAINESYVLKKWTARFKPKKEKK